MTNTEQKVVVRNVSVSIARPRSVAPSRCKNITLAELIVEKQALCLPWLILFSLASIKTGRLMHTLIKSRFEFLSADFGMVCIPF